MRRSTLHQGLLPLVLALTIVLSGCITAEDSDGDGVSDDEDHFPDDPMEWLDTDNDNVGDNSDIFPRDHTEWEDTDGDGHGDNSDAFPTDRTEWEDGDGDGHGDNSDVFPGDSEEWSDGDGDGYGDNADRFPKDPAYHAICTVCSGTGLVGETAELSHVSSADLIDRGLAAPEWHVIVEVSNTDVQGGIFTVQAWIIEDDDEVWSGQQRHFIGAGETYDFDLRAAGLASSLAPARLQYSVTPPSWLTGLDVPCDVCEGRGKT